MKRKWCVNEGNKTVAPTKHQREVARKRENRTSFWGTDGIPSGIPRPRLTCNSCGRRLLGEIIYDTTDVELIGFRVPRHVIKSVKKHKRTWDQRKTK
jgi:hypothetical protein